MSEDVVMCWLSDKSNDSLIVYVMVSFFIAENVFQLLKILC